MEDITNVLQTDKRTVVVDKDLGRSCAFGLNGGHALHERHACQEQQPPRAPHHKKVSEDESIELARRQGPRSSVSDICCLADTDSAAETQPRAVRWEEARDNSCQGGREAEGARSAPNSAVLQDTVARLNQVTHSIEVEGSRLQNTADIYPLILQKLESFEKTVEDLRLERDILADEVSRLQADSVQRSNSPCHNIANCGEGGVELLERMQALCTDLLAGKDNREQVEDSDDGGDHGAEASGANSQFYRAVARTFAKQVVSFASDFRTATDHKTLEEDLKRFEFWAEHQVQLFLQEG